MRMPEKTLLGLGGAVLLGSGFKGLVEIFNGTIAPHVVLASHATDPSGLAAAWMAGAIIGSVVKLLCGTGLLAMVMTRLRPLISNSTPVAAHPR